MTPLLSNIIKILRKTAFENIVGEGQNAADQHILFLQCFVLFNERLLLEMLAVRTRLIYCMLTLSQTSPGFLCLQYKSFENIEGKRRNCS